MAFLLLLFIGVLAGWFASIIARDESAGSILSQIGISLLVSLGAGLYMNGWSVLGSLQWHALATAIAASVIILLVYHLAFKRKGEEA